MQAVTSALFLPLHQETPLTIATRRRDLEVVRYLVKNGADVNLASRYRVSK